MNTARSLTTTLISEADYLASERQATERHEYVRGQVYLMAGASKRHNRIAMNCVVQMTLATRNTACNVYASEVKVHSEKYHCYYYPDVVVGCEPDEASDYILEQPCLIVEVSSDSTLRKDYLEKLLAYQTMPSLQAYLIVAQDKIQVDMLVRSADGLWELQQFNDLAAELNLPCPLMSLQVATIYEGLELLAD